MTCFTRDAFEPYPTFTERERENDCMRINRPVVISCSRVPEGRESHRYRGTIMLHTVHPGNSLASWTPIERVELKNQLHSIHDPTEMPVVGFLCPAIVYQFRFFQRFIASPCMAPPKRQSSRMCPQHPSDENLCLVTRYIGIQSTADDPPPQYLAPAGHSSSLAPAAPPSSPLVPFQFLFPLKVNFSFCAPFAIDEGGIGVPV